MHSTHPHHCADVLLNQYINLLEEKYYLLNENETRLCIDILKQKDNFNKYKSVQNSDNILHRTLHNFIWYTVPNRYNDTLVKIIEDLDLEILHKWKENGSSLSVRCAECNSVCDYHDSEHYYFDHRNNTIILNFQKNINQSEQDCKVIIDKDEYFKNMLLSDTDFYNNLKNKITANINK